MPQPPPPNPEHVEYAGERVAAGDSYRAIAAEFNESGVKVSHSTVRLWAKKWQAQQLAKTPGVDPAVKSGELSKPNALAAELAARKAQQPPAPAPTKLDAKDLPAALQALLDEVMGLAAAAKGSNNKTVTDNLRLASSLIGDLRQLQKMAAEDADMIKVSRAELEVAYRTLTLRVINPLRARMGEPPIELP